VSPVNLGDLPSTQPVPTGLGQIKRGAADAQVVCPANYDIFYDGAGNPMRIAITTGSRPGWWVIRAENIFVLADAAWYYAAWSVTLNMADVNGINSEFAHMHLHSALGWNVSCIDTAYRLNANTTYLATMYMRDRQAGTWYYWSGPNYSYISGEFIAEGSL
jgi:hypothetical protein